MCRVSDTSRINLVASRSRCFAEALRSTSWMSPRFVSASTSASHASPCSMASPLRRSPTIGTGTSVLHLTCVETRVLNLARSPRCARSRTGSPFGWSCAASCSPTTGAMRAARSIVSDAGSPRSARATRCAPTPRRRATSLTLRPLASRAVANSSPSLSRSIRLRRAPRPIGPSRATTSEACGSRLTCRSPVPHGLPLRESPAPAPDLDHAAAGRSASARSAARKAAANDVCFVSGAINRGTGSHGTTASHRPPHAPQTEQLGAGWTTGSTPRDGRRIRSNRWRDTSLAAGRDLRGARARGRGGARRSGRRSCRR